jgi:hypothetical protein
MIIYVLKAYEPDPDLRNPDVTRRAQEPDALDRIKVSVHTSLEAAQAGAQASFDKAYKNPPATGEDDEQINLEWIGNTAMNDTHEAEYEIEEHDLS